MEILNQKIDDRYAMYNGDCVEVLKGITDNSIHYSIFSPPFASLYTYSNSDRDMGNSASDNEFYEHFKFLISELYRVTMPGRLLSFHCMDLPMMKSRDGVIGLKDFPGKLKRMFSEAGFIYQSRVVIWKDPLVEATRTKALGLLHKQICKDSSMCRQGLPDYLVTMRKPGENPELIAQPDAEKYEKKEKYNEVPVYSHQVWRKYASPVWMDIRQSNTLNGKSAREEQDERHICPLQLDVIARGINLWTNENDIVLDPFAGIGSSNYVALKKGRRTIGVELKENYYNLALENVEKGDMDYIIEGITNEF